MWRVSVLRRLLVTKQVTGRARAVGSGDIDWRSGVG